MAKANGADALQRMTGGGNVATKERPKTIKDWIQSAKPSIQAALPRHVDVDRFQRIVMVAVNQNPKLGQCTPMSLLTAVMQAAQLGLEPGVLGQCYMIPYWNKNKKVLEVQFQISYKGMIELSRRSGSILSIAAHEVRENDEFFFQYAYEETLTHKPNLFGNRGDVIAYYAYANLKDGGRASVVMNKTDIDAHRDQFSKAAKSQYGSPWEDNYDEMAKKTVIKKLLKYLPVSAEVLRGVAADGAVRDEIKPDLADLPVMEDVETIEAEQPEEQPEKSAPKRSRKKAEPKPEPEDIPDESAMEKGQAPLDIF